ncbi:hypothetical protein HYX15_02580 [Candidatus Woesearchaeota archaeon]|nr:hypothetical protein [Candidatus Woesearchaeota archaeon]
MIKIKFEILVLVMVLLSFNVSAFGVVTSYWDTKPLILEPGESRNVYITLQNGAGATEEVTAKVELQGNGASLAQILDEDKLFLVPAGREVNVDIKVSIPNDAEIGEKYIIGVAVNALPEESNAPVLLGAGVGTSIPINVQYHEPLAATLTGESIKETNLDYNLMGIGALMLLLAIVIFIFYELHIKN